MARETMQADGDATSRRDDKEMEKVRLRYDAAKRACQTLYDLAGEDIEFVTVPGKQWDENLRARRRDRKCYEFGKLPAQVRQVLNEMRQNRPQGKIRGAGEGDAGLAEIMQGTARNIESVSNADMAYDIAYAAAVKGGMGCWRIVTDYANQDDFDLDIFIEPILNWRSVKFDAAAIKRDRSDAKFAFIEETMSRKAFEERWPDAATTDFFDDPLYVEWRPTDDQVRIAEYWWKEVEKRTLLAVTGPDGMSAIVFVDEDKGVTEETITAQGYKIVKSRIVETTKVYSRLTNGSQWLSEKVEFPSKYIPIIVTWGDIDTVDGEDYWQGMVRANKDQQRLHNVWRTAAMEWAAKAPKAPFVLDPEWIKGYERMWSNANAEDRPWLAVNSQALNGAFPQRVSAPEMPATFIQLGNLMNEDIKASTGQYDASLGARSNETSGKAISARQMQGATSTFNYIDNLAYAIRYQYQILVDMIPRVYDTQRVVRVLGEDGGAKWKQLYMEVVDPETGETRTLNDISKGKYDVTTTVGPGFATQRMEESEGFMQLLGQVGPTLPPEIAQLMAYKVTKNLDHSGGEEVAEAFRKYLVKNGVMQPKDGEEAPPDQSQPNPMQLAELRKTMAQAASAEADADKKTAEAVQVQLQNLLANGEFAQMLFQQFQAMTAGGAGGAGAPPAAAPPPPQPMLPAPSEPPQGGFLLAGRG